MSEPNIIIELDGNTLPVPDVPFMKQRAENATDNVTLDGTLYTDFVNIRRSWSVEWAKLSKEDYDLIEELYLAQFETGIYPMLEVGYYEIFVPVKLSLNDHDIRFDGLCAYNVKLTLS